VVDVIGEDLQIAAASVKDSIQDVVMRGDGHVRKLFLAEFSHEFSKLKFFDFQRLKEFFVISPFSWVVFFRLWQV